MRFFLTSLCFIFIFSSCTLSTARDFVYVENTVRAYKNPYFADLDKDYVYKANFEVYAHEFSGILIIKKLADEHHKIVFTTEFGTKMMDLELKDDDFIIHFIADDLNRKILINTLKKDFEILLQEDVKVDKSFKNERFNIFQAQKTKRSNYYFVNKENNQLENILNASRRKEKIVFNFESKDGKTAENVLIGHKSIKLKIKLRLI